MMEDLKWFIKKYSIWLLILLVCITIILFIAGMILSSCRTQKNQEEYPAISNESINDLNDATDKEIIRKGYDLPISDEDREISENYCLAVMESIKQTYKDSIKGDTLNKVISKEAEAEMLDILAKSNCPVRSSVACSKMYNYEIMESFIKMVQNGEKAEVVVYELYSEGGIAREKFIFDGKDMYFQYTNAVWNDKEEASITSTSYTRIKEWNYTSKGWLCYELCVPEPPEVTEAVNGNAMMRVKPIKKEYEKIIEKYLLPIGYQGNNLFCSEWDSEHMENLDYSGLFEYLYFMKYGQRMNQEKYADGISKEEFESVITEYLPVSDELLENCDVYDSGKRIYAWEKLGCMNYAPNAFGTSAPEITDMKENENGTTTITVDAVCEMLGNDAVFTHELTVRFLDDGGIQYLGNHVIDDGLEKIPAYQYRFEK